MVFIISVIAGRSSTPLPGICVLTGPIGFWRLSRLSRIRNVVTYSFTMSSTSTGGGGASDYMLVRITDVAAQSVSNLSANNGTGLATAETRLVTGKVIRVPAVGNFAYASF